MNVLVGKEHSNMIVIKTTIICNDDDDDYDDDGQHDHDYDH